MMELMIILCVIASTADIVKISLMTKKNAAIWCLLWGLCACAAILVVSGLPRAAILSVLCSDNVVLCCLVDMALMVAYLFSDGMIRRMLGFYPGFIVAVSVIYFSVAVIGWLPGVGYGIIGIGTGVAVTFSLAAFAIMAHRLGADASTLYQLILLSVIICIITYGMK